MAERRERERDKATFFFLFFSFLLFFKIIRFSRSSVFVSLAKKEKIKDLAGVDSIHARRRRSSLRREHHQFFPPFFIFRLVKGRCFPQFSLSPRLEREEQYARFSGFCPHLSVRHQPLPSASCPKTTHSSTGARPLRHPSTSVCGRWHEKVSRRCSIGGAERTIKIKATP